MRKNILHTALHTGVYGEILHTNLHTEEVLYLGHSGCFVSLGKVGINFVDGLGIRPAAQTDSLKLWDLKVVGQRSEAVAESVDTYLRQVVFPAQTVYLAPQGIGTFGKD